MPTIETHCHTPSMAIVSLIGEHDLSERGRLRLALTRAAIQAPDVIVDLSRCDLIDCTVIGLLLHAHDVVTRDGGSFGVALPEHPNAVVRVAHLVGLAQRLPTYPSLAVALARLERAAGGPASSTPVSAR